ncbi:hypothetical protein KKC44_02190 [Patescibacteria group bacterium]|nr:hypothetical protein [Patescibacteria group bacterium]MBU2259393.1 hypothetical protein [Patescibacteria group bacterium]
MNERMFNDWQSKFSPWEERRFIYKTPEEVGRRPAPDPEVSADATETGKDSKERERYVADLLDGPDSKTVKAAWEKIISDNEVREDEARDFSNAIKAELVDAGKLDTPEARAKLNEHLPLTASSVKSIAIVEGLTSIEALEKAAVARSGRRVGAASPGEEPGRRPRVVENPKAGEQIREQIREVKRQEYKMQKEINYMRSRLCRIRRDSPDYRSKYGQFLLVRTQLRRQALDLVKKYEEETGERYITGEGLRAMQKKALELQYPTDSSLVEGMSPRERAIEESELQHVVSSAPPDKIVWDPATLSIYHRAKRFGGNPGHTVMRIQDEARSARLHREVVDDICSDAWARRNLSEASLRKPPQYVFRAPTEYVEGIKKAGLEWSSVPYVETGMSIRDRGRLSQEKSADRARSVSEEIFYDKFNDEMMRGEYDKYAGLPGYEEFREEIRRKIKYWEKYPDRNDPKSRFGDLARIRAMKLEMDRRLDSRQIMQVAWEEVSKERELGLSGIMESVTIPEPTRGEGFRFGSEVAITYEDTSGRLHRYRYHPWAEIKTKGRFGSDTGLMEQMAADGILIKEKKYRTKFYESDRKRPVVKELEINFRFPGKYTIQGPHYNKTLFIKQYPAKKGELEGKHEAIHLSDMDPSKSLAKRRISFSKLFPGRDISQLKKNRLEITVGDYDLDGSHYGNTVPVDLLGQLRRNGQKIYLSHGMWVQRIDQNTYDVYFNSAAIDGTFKIIAKDMQHGLQSQPIIVKIPKGSGPTPRAATA